ncbi:MAG: alpha-ribazole phosphatase [Pseudomonadota bacterium]
MRHTTPDVAPGICYGRTDLDVASSFEVEAAAALAELPAFERIVSSPLQRCRKLAEFISAQVDLQFDIDPRLKEMDFGNWEGRPWSRIERSELDAWAADFYHARPHGGESVAILQARVREALEDLRDQDIPTLIVCHAGIIRAALAHGEAAKDFNTEIAFGGFVTMSNTEGVLHE